MAQLTITTTAAQDQRIAAAFTERFGYTGTRPDGTAETKAQFVKRMVIEFIKDTVREHEEMVAVRQAQDAARADVDATLTPT